MTEQELIKKHPKLFKQKDLPMTQTAMCWGIECGPGWYSIIDELCTGLQNLTDKQGHPQVEFTQVKEKFGSLRVYTDGASAAQFELIDRAEELSMETCERCGRLGKLREGSWVVTLCDDCLK